MLTARQTAERLKVSKDTVLRFIKDGRLPGSRKRDPLKKTSPMLIPVASIEALERELSGYVVEPTEKKLTDTPGEYNA